MDNDGSSLKMHPAPRLAMELSPRNIDGSQQHSFVHSISMV